MRCGDQQTLNLHISTCLRGLVQTRNTKARPHTPHTPVAADDALPRSSVATAPKLAGYKGEQLRRRRG